MTSPAEVIEDSDLSHLEPFSKQGIRLSYLLNEFVETCGGSKALKGLTTTEVSNKFVKPATEKCQSSYCDMFIEQQNQKSEHDDNDNVAAVDRATVFISHAWQYDFLHVLSALEDHFKDEPDIIIWIDLFSNNQHKASNLPYEWWQTVFKSAIKELGHTVMVMSPWNDPIPYTRAWCIFEAYCTTLKSDSRFEIAMSAKEHENFIKDAINNPTGMIDTMLSVINAEKSTAFLPQDRDRIFEVIREEVGFSKINSLVFEQLRQWVIGVGEKELKMNQDEKRHPGLLRMLGLLYQGQGNYQTSQPLLEEALEKRKATLGDVHPNTLTSMNNLASLYQDQGKYNAAEPLYVECLEKSKSALGDDHPGTLTSINNLALLYQDQGKYNAAEPLYVECLEKSKATLGDDHPDTLLSMNNLALLYQNQGKYNAAEPLYVECLEKRKATLGDDHPDTLQYHEQLGIVV